MHRSATTWSVILLVPTLDSLWFPVAYCRHVCYRLQTGSECCLRILLKYRAAGTSEDQWFTTSSVLVHFYPNNSKIDVNVWFIVFFILMFAIFCKFSHCYYARRSPKQVFNILAILPFYHSELTLRLITLFVPFLVNITFLLVYLYTFSKCLLTSLFRNIFASGVNFVM